MKLTTILAFSILAYFFGSQLAIGLGRKIEAAQAKQIATIERALTAME